MTKKKLTDAEQLVNDLTPYVVHPESGTAEFVIRHTLQYLIDNFYEYFPQLQDEDEFYGKLYGSHGKIEVERLENMITQLQTMETIKKEQLYWSICEMTEQKINSMELLKPHLLLAGYNYNPSSHRFACFETLEELEVRKNELKQEPYKYDWFNIVDLRELMK